MARRLTAEEIVREVQAEARRRVIARTDGQAMEEIAAAWAPHFERLRDRILTARSSAEVQGMVSETMRDLARAAVRPSQRSIRRGAIFGMEASDRQHTRLTERGGPVTATAEQRASVASSVSRERAREMAAARIRGEGTPDGIRLSSRLHARAREVADHAATVVRSSIDARTGIFEASEELLQVAAPQLRLEQPRYLERIVREARVARDTGDRTRLLEVIEGHRNQLNRLGQGAGRADGMYSLRSTVRQFVRDVQLRPEDVDELLREHMADRAQFVARRIVRHETAEAMRASYLESIRDQPYCKGIRWTLSPAHPRPDVCDLFAMQALHGLGPGGYPLDEVPDTPHPLCLCSHEAIIDRQHFRRELAQARGQAEPPRTWEDPRRQTAREWLAEQPEDFRREVLGDTRLAIFDASAEGRRHVITSRGMPIPVAEAVESWSRRSR